VLACGILSYHDSVPDSVFVWDAFGIFTHVISLDKRLLSILDVLPVGNEIDISNGVSAEY